MHASEAVAAWQGPSLPFRTRPSKVGSKPAVSMQAHTKPVPWTPKRRTLLECMPRRAIFRTLSFLSFPDTLNLLCADKRLRPFVLAPTFSPWRKRYTKFRLCLLRYEKALSHAGQDGVKEGRLDEEFVRMYTETLASFHMGTPPIHLHQALHGLEATRQGPTVWPPKARHFIMSWILGRVPASDVFLWMDHAMAVELLSFLRLFLLVVRLTRAFLPSTASSSQDHQMFHVLEADCARALETFFAPRPKLIAPSTLTHEQQRFVDCPVTRSDLIRVQAYAGVRMENMAYLQTGKTLSLLAFAAKRPRHRFLYITFNVAAAKSARERFTSNVDCHTMHSVALRHTTLPEGQTLGNLRPRDVVSLFQKQLPTGHSTKPTEAGRSNTLAPTTVACYILKTLDRFIQSTDHVVRPDTHVPKSMTKATDLDPADVSEMAQRLWYMIVEGKTPQGKAVVCPHDAYVKQLQLQGGLAPRVFTSYNALLLDEAQDLSACQTELLLGARGHCAVIVVGDVHQKIYGFRGGSAKAFHERLYPSTKTFQLTKSFRFGPEVARIATQILRLKAPPPWYQEQSMGVWPRPRLTGHDHDEVFVRPSVMPKPYTCVYRTNALLARDMLQLAVTLPASESMYLKMSQTFTVQALTLLLRDAHRLYHNQPDAVSHTSPLRDFISWKELTEHVEAEEGGNTKLHLVLSLEELISAPDFMERVDGLRGKFCAKEEDAAVILTTVHQAKGLEWDCVVVADDFSPTLQACVPGALRPQVAQWLAQDELNHMYVALTRARRTLILPPCLLTWLTALEGRFRYRFMPKQRKVVCPQCQAAACLIQICTPYARTSHYDAQTTTIGCLVCLRQQVSSDEDLADFVRWIDGSGVSTTTGKWSDATLDRMLRKRRAEPSVRTAKRVRSTATSSPPSVAPLAACAPAERATTYQQWLGTSVPSIPLWLASEAYWRSKST